ncbi:MAG: hypothetical protein SFY56_13895 [Bacteroidota bacterium]|nr:hypothetical protein [Bacteroidota bacterium]
MKYIKFYSLIIAVFTLNACSKKTYPSNGETIYRTGKNINGVKMLDRSASRIKFIQSCATCHGKSGDRMNGVSIKFSDLSNPELYSVPYTDSLFYRFLDDDLKSDGTKADIGVIWKMSDQDKRDLLEYLKTL